MLGTLHIWGGYKEARAHPPYRIQPKLAHPDPHKYPLPLGIRTKPYPLANPLKFQVRNSESNTCGQWIQVLHLEIPRLRSHPARPRAGDGRPACAPPCSGGGPWTAVLGLHPSGIHCVRSNGAWRCLAGGHAVRLAFERAGAQATPSMAHHHPTRPWHDVHAMQGTKRGRRRQPLWQLACVPCPTLPCRRPAQHSEERNRPADMAMAEPGERGAEPDELRVD